MRPRFCQWGERALPTWMKHKPPERKSLSPPLLFWHAVMRTWCLAWWWLLLMRWQGRGKTRMLGTAHGSIAEWTAYLQAPPPLSHQYPVLQGTELPCRYYLQFSALELKQILSILLGGNYSKLQKNKQKDLERFILFNKLSMCTNTPDTLPSAEGHKDGWETCLCLPDKDANDSKVYMEMRGTQKSQSNLEKGQSWQGPSFSILKLTT